MHPLVGLSGLLLMALAGFVALGMLGAVRGWSARRGSQLAILATPVVGLALVLAGLHHFVGRVCFLGAPPWDQRLALAAPLVMGAVAIGGVGLGIVRLALMELVVGRRGTVAGPELQTMAGSLADQLGAPRPRVRLYAHGRPLALTYGLWRPVVLLSSWMVEHLDPRELEAVLAHEIGHAARRDYLVAWLATMLRDAFCYLPASWLALAQLRREKEPACDELAVRATGRPLALASALGKVWQDSFCAPAVVVAQPLAGTPAAVERRIERLLAEPEPSASRSRSGDRAAALAIAAGATAVLAGAVVLGTLNVTAMLTAMGCGPGSPLWKLIGR